MDIVIYKNGSLCLVFLYFFSCVCLGKLIFLKIGEEFGFVIVGFRVMIRERLVVNFRIWRFLFTVGIVFVVIRD